MPQTKIAINSFKSFVAQSDSANGNIFRVADLQEKVTREQIETLLAKLPISFTLHQNESDKFDHINEPLDVYVHGAIVCIYPPKYRVLACTHFDSWASSEIISRMHVDNVMDTENPGNGQVRTCVHFDPAILGIKNWPNASIANELEVDIFVYPKGMESKPQLKKPRFSKSDVRALLELIAGGEKLLTPEKLESWRDLIMYAVDDMKYSYENDDVAEDYNVRVYYKPCWEKIKKAGNDSEKLVEALEDLRSSIKWE